MIFLTVHTGWLGKTLTSSCAGGVQLEKSFASKRRWLAVTAALFSLLAPSSLTSKAAAHLQFGAGEISRYTYKYDNGRCERGGHQVDPINVGFHGTAVHPKDVIERYADWGSRNTRYSDLFGIGRQCVVDHGLTSTNWDQAASRPDVVFTPPTGGRDRYHIRFFSVGVRNGGFVGDAHYEKHEREGGCRGGIWQQLFGFEGKHAVTPSRYEPGGFDPQLGRVVGGGFIDGRNKIRDILQNSAYRRDRPPQWLGNMMPLRQCTGLYASNDGWLFWFPLREPARGASLPPCPRGSGQGPRIGVVDRINRALVKEQPNNCWIHVKDDVRKLVLSSNPPRIGVITTDRQVYVKEGATDAPWVHQADNAVDLELAGDVIGVLREGGGVQAKKGSLQAGWSPMMGDVFDLVLGYDRMGVTQWDYRLFVKEGLSRGLSGLWSLQMRDTVAAALTGDRIGALQPGEGPLWVKRGGLDAQWTLQTHGAVEAKMGGTRICYISTGGVVHCKSGGLDAVWSGPQIGNAVDIAVAPDRLAVVTEDGNAYYKHGPLNATWSLERTQVKQVALNTE